MTTTYTVSTDPADPEAAAREPNVLVPTDAPGHHSPPRDALQDFASLLHAERRSPACPGVTPAAQRPWSSSARSTKTTRPPCCRGGPERCATLRQHDVGRPRGDGAGVEVHRKVVTGSPIAWEVRGPYLLER